MKKAFIVVAVWALVSLLCIFIINKCAFAEVPIKFNSKMCKMEIITSENIKNRNAKNIVEKNVLHFCEDKYVYDISVAADNGKYIYVIIYNDKAE